MLPWLFPLALLVLVVAVAVAPGWITGLIAVVVLGIVGYGAVAWYYRRYQQFHRSDDRS
jgi:Flp pilus assembly protein TadB